MGSNRAVPIILVVSKDPELLSLLDAGLTESGYLALSSMNGQGSLTASNEIEASLIILDTRPEGAPSGIDDRDVGADLLELRDLGPQLDQLLPAEDSAEMPHEDEHARSLRPEFPQPKRSPVGIPDLDVSKLRARLMHGWVTRFARPRPWPPSPPPPRDA
jgi:hypothetical protein